jgi:hypothetical protein
MPPAGFEPTIPESERTQTHALDRAATGIGQWRYIKLANDSVVKWHSSTTSTYFAT